MMRRISSLIIMISLPILLGQLDSTLANTGRDCSAETEWAWLNPLPQGDDLNGIWGHPTSNVFAVGDHGTILRLTGPSWAVMESNTTERLNDVWVAPNGEAFAVGDWGTLLRWNGGQWVHQASSVTLHLLGVWGTAHDNVFAVGQSGTIIHYNGSNWSSMASGTLEWLNDIWGFNGSAVFAVGEGGTVLRFNGSNWTPMVSGTTKGLKSVSGSSATNVVAVGDDDIVIRFDGSGWSDISPSGTGHNWRAVWVFSPSYFVVAGAGGALREWYDGDWGPAAPNPIGNTPDHNAIWSSSPSTWYTVSDWGQIVRRGSDSEMMAGGFTYDLKAVWGSSENNVFATNEIEEGYGFFYRYDGISWEEAGDGPTQYCIWGSGPDEVYSVGGEGLIYRYEENYFHDIARPTYETLYGIWGSSPSDIFIVGQGSTLLHYDGDSFTDMTLEAPVAGLELRGVWGSAPNNVFVAGSSRILHFDGADWTVHFADLGNNPQFLGIWGSGPDDVFAVGSDEIIYHYNGSGWTQQQAGLNSGVGLTSVSGTSPTDVYAVSEYGEIIHYDGMSWSLAHQSASRSLSGVFSLDPCDVFVVGEKGTVQRYYEPDPTDVPPVSMQPSVTLYHNTPNPFNPATTIRFELSSAANVRVDVYDVTGRRVATLVGGHRQAGEHLVTWEGRTDEGVPAGSGVYFYRLVTPTDSVTRKMVLLK